MSILRIWFQLLMVRRVNNMSEVKNYSRNKDFNEATRVQMPALVHLSRLGYKYFGKITEDMKGIKYDGDTNILLEVFKEQFKKLNLLMPEKLKKF